MKKKKKSKKEKGILARLKSKVVSKPILKKTKEATLKIKDKEIPKVLEDTNRFFKNEWEETKKAMFFK